MGVVRADKGRLCGFDRHLLTRDGRHIDGRITNVTRLEQHLVMCARWGAGGQGGDGGDLGRVEVLPEEPLWPPGAATGNHLLAGHNQVQAEVVGGLRQRLVQHLQRVDGSRQHGVAADQAGIGQDSRSASREAAEQAGRHRSGTIGA